MNLCDYADETIIEEVIRRNIELKIHVGSVEVSVSLGGVELGDTQCTEKK